jgi:DNA polymerase
MSMEEYINDKRFQIIGVGIKIDDNPSEWYPGDLGFTSGDINNEHIKEFLEYYDIPHCALLCHNAYFDGAILAWKFGIVPSFYFDTMCMCKITDGVLASASLAAMSERHGTGVKGNDLKGSLGKRLEDFSEEGLRAFGMYCRNDVEITRKLFDKLAESFPESEVSLIDLTIRMFTQPTLEIDDVLLVQKLQYIKDTKSVVLAALMNKLQCEDEEGVRKKLSSNKMFAQVLEELGVMVPTKESPATGKQTYALAKNDPGFIELMESPDQYVQEICAARLGVKSTMEESRIEKFINIGARNNSRLPVPLKYCAAHTLRWGGMDGINIQNLPSRNKDKRTLKNSIRAPAGHVIVHGDSSQVEARKLAWWAGQDNVVESFRRKEDVYCHDASDVYGRHITKSDERERFVGKTMRLGLGYGTGAEKLRHMLLTSQMSIDLPLATCQEHVNKWRYANKNIRELWAEANQALYDVMAWPENKKWYWLGKHDAVLVTPLGFKLPNNTFIRYKNLRLIERGKIVHDSRYGQSPIWGGTVVENVTQALARITIGEQMVNIATRYRPVLTVHDSVAIVATEQDQRNAVECMEFFMSQSPLWAIDLPLACEIKVGATYGEC